MNRYHILSFITAICNVILAVCFILFIDELNKDYTMLEDPTPTGDVCDLCNKLEYYSYTNHNEILTEIYLMEVVDEI